MKNAGEGEKALERALTQIRERDYGSSLPGRDLVRFGIVFTEDLRRFCRIGMA